MSLRPLSFLLEMLLAAGGPREMLAARLWPMHRVLLELQEASQAGPSLVLPEMRAYPDAAVGRRVEGADTALWQLRSAGLLTACGSGPQARYSVDPRQLVDARRQLMRVAAGDVELLYRAGSRWAALAATASKNFSVPCESSASTVVSERPVKRRGRPLPGAS